MKRTQLLVLRMKTNKSDLTCEEPGKNLAINSLGDNNSPNERRIKVPPVWMRDYEMGEGLSEEEAYSVMFAAINPVPFEDVVKSEMEAGHGCKN